MGHKYRPKVGHSSAANALIRLIDRADQQIAQGVRNAKRYNELKQFVERKEALIKRFKESCIEQDIYQ